MEAAPGGRPAPGHLRGSSDAVRPLLLVPGDGLVPGKGVGVPRGSRPAGELRRGDVAAAPLPIYDHAGAGAAPLGSCHGLDSCHRLGRRNGIAAARHLVRVSAGLGGRITVAALLASIFAQSLLPLILRFAIPAALGARIAMAALLPAIFAEALLPLILKIRDTGCARGADRDGGPAPGHLRESLAAAHPQIAIPVALGARIAMAALLPAIFAEALPPRALSFAIAEAPGQRAVAGLLPPHRRGTGVVILPPIYDPVVASAARRGNVWTPAHRRESRFLAIIRLAVEIVRPSCLVVGFIGRLDNVVEPLADRKARRAGGPLARSGARFRTETSKIPRTARFHSRVQAT